MLVVLWIVVVLFVVVCAGIVAGQAGWLKGRKPEPLGVSGGRLQPASKTPNSVVSQAPLPGARPVPASARIEPLALRGDGPATIARIKAIVERMADAEIVRSDADYLYAQFTTRLMKFVDDTEFWFDPAAQVVQVRSASRLGQRDFDANRKRVEAIRQRLTAAA